ncbi:DEAD/DEAH box helicase [Candidatus Woesearchaeota archaeon]|nr:DEAD/DEAH box helicase [Candidatus Woesearchaeota archaeon]
MDLTDIKDKIPSQLFEVFFKRRIDALRPCQEKAVNAGLFEGKNLVVCTPTASGKTMIAEMACAKNILDGKGKAVYIVPLKALATEKYKEFKKEFPFLRVGLAIGDLDSKDNYLGRNDLIIATAEKLDSLIRHKSEWIKDIFTIIVDETHLINDPSRGPTVEILITMLRNLLPSYQLIALSATIGNPDILAEWLEAELVLDNWRPVKLYSGTYLDGKLQFY